MMQEYLPIHICLLLAANRILISKASFLLFRLRVEVGVNCCGADSFQSCRGKDFSAYILTALTAFHSCCIICFQVSSLSLSNKISVSKDLAGWARINPHDESGSSAPFKQSKVLQIHCKADIYQTPAESLICMRVFGFSYIK